MLINDMIKHYALESPERIAYLFEKQKVSYKQLNQQIQAFAGGLKNKGFHKGDRIALLAGNSPHFVIAYHGILRAGLVVVPINPTYTPHEISYILLNSQSKGLVALGALSKMLNDPRVKVQLPELLSIYIGDYEGEGVSFSEFCQSTEVLVDEELQENDLACILYTSGTTGTPKGAMLSHRNLSSNAQSIGKLTKLSQEDRVVATLPMFHVFCMTVCLNAPLYAGASILIIPRFSPTELVDSIQEHQATVFAGVPTMYNFIYQTSSIEQTALQSLRLCISGGASLPVNLLHHFEKKFGVTILEGYGLSEASPVTAFNPLEGVRKPGSIGVNIPDVQNKIVDDHGNELPPGEEGELIVKGPNVMLGYLNMPEETAKTIIDGWLYTGDIAKMDEDGYFYIVDRKKDIIIVGGYNVYPREVEEVLYTYPGITEAAVIGIEDQHYGEAVHAFIVSSKQEALTETEIIVYCGQHLAKYKVPSKVHVMDSLPKNSTGKIMKRELKEKFQSLKST